MKLRSLLVSVCLLCVYLNSWAQNHLVGSYAITAVKRVFHHGDSVLAIYQPDNVIFVDRFSYPEYTKGLPDSLPNVPDGKYILYHASDDSAQCYTREIGYYKNHKKDSICIKYFQNGNQRKITHYKHSNRDGREMEWDEEGKVRYDVFLKNGLLHGKCKFYDREFGDGFSIAEGSYANGVRAGKWTFYYDENDSLACWVEKYYDGLGKYKYAEKQYTYDTLVKEQYVSNTHRIMIENGTQTNKTNLKKEKRTQEKAVKKAVQKRKKIEKTSVLRNIRFDSSSSYLDTSSYQTLDKFITMLKQNPTWVIELNFHTMFASEKEPTWIQETINHLIKQGIHGSRILPINFSNAVPLKRRILFKCENQWVEWRVVRK